MTSYIVLRRSSVPGDDEESWETCGPAVEAMSANAAIRAAAGGTEGTFFASPARSFQPVVVKVETVEKVTLSGGKKPTPKAKVEEPAAA